MKLDKEEKRFRNDLIKIAKSYKDKSKIAHVIDFLIDKDIYPSCIDIKQVYKASNGLEMNYDIVVYKDNNKRTNENIILIVKFIDDSTIDKYIVDTSYNYFSSMPNMFFILFYNNNKKMTLTFKNVSNDKMLINKTKEIPSFKWTYWFFCFI